MKRAGKAQAKDKTPTQPNRNTRVWAVVERIPSGKVATYGQIAALAAVPGRSGARQVGYALASLGQDSDIPWHRVINAQGRLSPRADPDAARYQRLLLEAEGIGFDHRQIIDLEQYRWQPTN